ncbi:MAG: DUF6049 family protein [Acidimicrobiales bacterium]
MRLRVVGLGLLVVTLAMVSLTPAAQARVPDVGPAPEVELVSQTPVAEPGGSFVVTVRLSGIPADGSVALTVHQRVRSRSELAQSMEGEGLRSVVFPLVVPLSDLPPQPDGTRRVELSLDTAAGGLSLPTEGVYPVELTAHDAAGAPLATLVTHLIVPPEAGDDSPNLAVALVAEVAAPTALQPDGAVRLARPDVDDLTALVSGLTAAPDVPATLSVRPETVEGLQSSPEPLDAELVPALQAAAGGRMVLAEPYVPIDLDALAAADLLAEVRPQQDRGRAVLTDALGAAPDGTVQLAPPTLGADGLAVTAFGGIGRLVVDDERLEPLAEGIIDYSLAQPFVVAVPEESDVEDRTPGRILALSPDPIMMERLNAGGSPGLVVSQVLAELALLRLERPSVARASVLRLTPGLPSATVAQLVQAIGTGRPFEAVSLPDAFERAEPLLDAGGNPAERALEPAESEEISTDTARAVTDRRTDLATFTTLVGPDSPLPDLPSRHLLIATGAEVDDADREGHLAAAGAAMADVAGGVTTPATFSLTLTAREGTIPLTIRNDSGVPVEVLIRLRSQKLEFPDGDTIELELVEESTRIDIRVRSRATGAFPLLIDVRTPDGERSLSMSRYTVRSTAVSGAGLLLSVGAGVFLTVWWARHWRRTRRSRKLVSASAHPSTSPSAGAGGMGGRGSAGAPHPGGAGSAGPDQR